jgi:hypothetical protein
MVTPNPTTYTLNANQVLRYVNNVFSEKQQTTIQASFLSRKLTIGDSQVSFFSFFIQASFLSCKLAIGDSEISVYMRVCTSVYVYPYMYMCTRIPYMCTRIPHMHIRICHSGLESRLESGLGFRV